jgi:hypothetical protein
VRQLQRLRRSEQPPPSQARPRPIRPPSPTRPAPG